MTLLTLRSARVYDAPAVFQLLCDYQDSYLDDFKTLDKAWVLHILPECHVLMAKDALLGVIWFSDAVPRLHATVHLLLRPRAWRWLRHTDCIEALIQQQTRQHQWLKLKATVMETQRSAIKLLKNFGFVHVGTLQQETLKNGKPMTCFSFERLLHTP
jgi:RimJ/RimL family protein N-acetyltransferase